MDIVLNVSPPLSTAIRSLAEGEKPPGDHACQSMAEDLDSRIRRYGGHLVPLHAGTGHGELDDFFLVRNMLPIQASQLVDVLRRRPMILAAYIKPADDIAGFTLQSKSAAPAGFFQRRR